MRATAGALLHIAVSILLVALLTSGLFMMAIASFDLASDDDVLSGIRQSTKYFRYELNAASEPVPPEKLLELATPLATKAFLERSTDTVFLLVVGPPDLAPVRAVLRESGYSPRTIRMGYHFPTILEELTSGHILALLLLAQLASLSLVGLWRCKRTKLTWFRGNPRRALAVGAAVGLCAATVAAALAQLAKVFGIALNEQSWVQPAVESAPVTTAIFVFLVVVLGPLAEEIFFRGSKSPWTAAHSRWAG